ncbi:hypothetical protein Anapl_10347 [Anas platyrhynchos]|uniref:Uncharacterized protein n=1 Tax=Anas platyrhynchos TaxID=8839 RepID=R0L6A5_ANAPL|nr:hypothetical protein Anapl_10347 [Anas platyrhynchos]
MRPLCPVPKQALRARQTKGCPGERGIHSHHFPEELLKASLIAICTAGSAQDVLIDHIVLHVCFLSISYQAASAMASSHPLPQAPPIPIDPEEVRSSTSWHDNQCLHFNKNQPQMTPRVPSGTAGARAICACCRNKRDTGQVAHNADLCLYFVHVKARLFLACELRSR